MRWTPLVEARRRIADVLSYKYVFSWVRVFFLMAGDFVPQSWELTTLARSSLSLITFFFFWALGHWVVGLEVIRRLCAYLPKQHSRRIVHIGMAVTLAHDCRKIWRKTVVLKLPTVDDRNLAASTRMLHYLYSVSATSAGSLAVILQPAFLSFDRAVTYLLDFSPYLIALCALNIFRFTSLPMFITLYAWASVSLQRFLVLLIASKKLLRVCAWFWPR